MNKLLYRPNIRPCTQKYHARPHTTLAWARHPAGPCPITLHRASISAYHIPALATYPLNFPLHFRLYASPRSNTFPIFPHSQLGFAPIKKALALRARACPSFIYLLYRYVLSLCEVRTPHV